MLNRWKTNAVIWLNQLVRYISKPPLENFSKPRPVATINAHVDIIANITTKYISQFRFLRPTFIFTSVSIDLGIIIYPESRVKISHLEMLEKFGSSD